MYVFTSPTGHLVGHLAYTLALDCSASGSVLHAPARGTIFKLIFATRRQSSPPWILVRPKCKTVSALRRVDRRCCLTTARAGRCNIQKKASNSPKAALKVITPSSSVRCRVKMPHHQYCPWRDPPLPSTSRQKSLQRLMRRPFSSTLAIHTHLHYQ